MSTPPTQYIGPPRIPMKYVDGPSTRPTAADQKALGRLITDPKWVFEQKFDGTRGLVVISSTPHPGQPRVWWPGRNGRASLAHTAATQHFSTINPVLESILGGTPGEMVFDGEIMTESGEFWIFDAPYMRFGGVEVIRPTDTFAQRRVALDAPDLTSLLSNTVVKVVRQACTARDKRTLLDLVTEQGGEGVMAKHVDHRYLSGERAPDTSAVKIKLVKTADCIVTSVNRPDAKHGSAGLAVWSSPSQPEQFMVNVGGCSLIGKPEVAVGDVVEIEYLYWTGSALYQPRLKRTRPDKDAIECTVDQFRTYSRKAV